MLNQNYRTIRDEFIHIYEEDFNNLHQFTTCVKEGGIWNVFLLIQNGRIEMDNVNRCPKTWDLIKNLNLLTGVRYGYCYFSILRPDTYVTPHYGVYNFKLRCQLPLIVPNGVDDENLYLKVRNDIVYFREGQGFVFDDSYLHEVTYNNHENVEMEKRLEIYNNRVVLLFDFWHPDLSSSEIEGIKYCLPFN